MIPYNELKLDNWVIGEHIPIGSSIKETFLCQIYELNPEFVRVYVDGHVIACTNIEAIPITHEILEQCGFVWIYDLGIYSNNGIGIDDDSYYVAVDYEGAKERVIKIQSLHQLQNLYFALTGEELEVNINQLNVIYS